MQSANDTQNSGREAGQATKQLHPDLVKRFLKPIGDQPQVLAGIVKSRSSG